MEEEQKGKKEEEKKNQNWTLAEKERKQCFFQ